MACAERPDPGWMCPVPDRGRIFSGQARVRLGDAGPSGRVRLDALARYLQDVASDDAEDADLEEDRSWVVRRTVLQAERLPALGDRLELSTFCGGYGARWAERRTRVTGPGGALVDAVALWVCLDRAGRPVPISDRFHAAYDEAAGDRRVSARLVHPDPPGQADGPGPPACQAWPWTLRATDIDVLGHVNNAATWEMVEEAMARLPMSTWRRAELEYRGPLDGQDLVGVRCRATDGAISLWAEVDGGVRASARVFPA